MKHAIHPSPTGSRPPEGVLEAARPSVKLTYTIRETAAALGLSRATIYKMIARGELETFHWCGRTLIRADVLQGAVDRASGRVAA